jgi:hypothetical protein
MFYELASFRLKQVGYLELTSFRLRKIGFMLLEVKVRFWLV